MNETQKVLHLMVLTILREHGEQVDGSHPAVKHIMSKPGIHNLPIKIIQAYHEAIVTEHQRKLDAITKKFKS